MTAPVVVVGDVLIDELRENGHSTSLPGGSALNVAVGLAVLGTPSVLVGMIGDDDDGRVIRAYLKKWGVDFVPTLGPRGTGRAISDRRGGEPTYSFNRASREREIRIDDTLAGLAAHAELIAVSGYPFDNDRQVATLLDLISGSGATVAVDPNPREGMLADRHSFRANLERVAASTALLKLSEEDAELLYEERLEDVVHRYLPLVSLGVLATAGDRGARLYTRESAHVRPIVDDPRPIVDTMGAGDASFAVVLSAMSAASPAADAWPAVLETAMLAAAETIRHPGALLRRHQRMVSTPPSVTGRRPIR